MNDDVKEEFYKIVGAFVFGIFITLFIQALWSY